MNEWEKCQRRFPHRTTLTESEKEHIPIAFNDHFAATDQGQRFLFGLLTDDIFWSAGPTHPWHYLEDNELVGIEVFSAGFLDKEYIDNLNVTFWGQLFHPPLTFPRVGPLTHIFPWSFTLIWTTHLLRNPSSFPDDYQSFPSRDLLTTRS